MNKISTEKAIEVLYTVRANYASLTVGYPKGKDCKGIGDVMCSEIANSCLKAIEVLEQESADDAISRQAAIYVASGYCHPANIADELSKLPSVTPVHKIGHWIYDDATDNWRCDKCGETPKTMGYVGTDKFMAEHFKFCNHCGAKMVELQERSDKE